MSHERNSGPHGKGRPERALLAVLVMAPFMSQADATIANVAGPAIGRDLHASSAQLELTVSAYLVAYATLVITGARLGDRYGHRRLFLLGFVLLGVVSCAAGLAPTPAALIVLRLAQGAAAALLFPQALTVIQRRFEGAARVRAIGAYSAAAAVGATVGQLAGGLLVTQGDGGWRWAFLINVPVCAAVVAAGRRWLPRETPYASGRGLDLPGTAVLSAALLAIVVPLALGRGAGWPWWSWSLLAAGAALLVAFVLLERRVARRGADALVDVAVIGRRPVAGSLLSMALGAAAYFVLMFCVTRYVQDGLGRSAVVSGLMFVPWVAGFAAAGQLARRAAGGRAGAGAQTGYALAAVAFALLAGALALGRTPLVAVAALLGVAGLGVGLGFALLLGFATGSVEPAHAASVSGVSATTLPVGASLGVSAIGTLYLDLVGADRSEVAARHGLAVTVAVLAALAVVAVATARHATTVRRGPERAPRPVEPCLTAATHFD